MIISGYESSNVGSSIVVDERNQKREMLAQWTNDTDKLFEKHHRELLAGHIFSKLDFSKPGLYIKGSWIPSLSNSTITALPPGIVVEEQCHFNHFSALKALPDDFAAETVRFFHCSSLKLAPQAVKKNLSISHCVRPTFPENFNVPGTLRISNSNIESLSKGTVGGDLILENCPELVSLNDVSVEGNLIVKNCPRLKLSLKDSIRIGKENLCFKLIEVARDFGFGS